MPGAKLTAAAVASALTIGISAASATTNASLTGTVLAAGKPLAGAAVTLAVGTRTGVTKLSAATTDTAGTFHLSYPTPTAGVLYVSANDTAHASSLRLLSVVGIRGGGIARTTLTTVKVDELTTVATTYALAQFVNGSNIEGPSPGLENAAATSFSLADPASGAAGNIVTNANNGAKNTTLATLNTLADLVSTCATATSTGRCAAVLRLATPPGGARPSDTAQALVDLAKNPTLSPAKLFALAKTATVYTPALAAPPNAWILALLYTDTDLYASGRLAIDAKGNIWSGNNWQPDTTKPSTMATALDPTGEPTFGSPIGGGGIDGVAWGTAVGLDGSEWFANFAGNSMTKLSANGTPVSPGAGWSNGGLSYPQGVAVDQKGNVWIANSYGPESAPDQGDVVVYPGGDPTKAITITGGGLNHPFSIQIDGRGNAWVTNAGLGGAKLVGTRAAPLIGKFGGSVTVIGPDFKPTRFSPIESSSFRLPLGLALDQQGNAWVTSFFGHTQTEIAPNGSVIGTFKIPGGSFLWSNAVDGSDRVWVSGFSIPGVWLLCGENTAACPPGSATGDLLSPKLGFRSAAMQHLTSIQVDQSGNVWLSNNWSKIKPPTGGVGVVELVGIATPVCTPLIGVPVVPSAASANACASTALEASGTAKTSSATGISSWWVWLILGLAVGLAAVTILLFFDRRRGKKRSGQDSTGY
jgi:hypothetical protein